MEHLLKIKREKSPEPPIMDMFVLREVEPNRVNRDMRLFFTHTSSWRSRDVDVFWMTGRQLDLHCERAAGLFVHAIATIRFADQKNMNPKEQLDRLLRIKRMQCNRVSGAG